MPPPRSSFCPSLNDLEPLLAGHSPAVSSAGTPARPLCPAHPPGSASLPLGEASWAGLLSIPALCPRRPEPQDSRSMRCVLPLPPRCCGVSGVLRDGCMGAAVTAVLCSGQGSCPGVALPCWPVWRPWLPSAVSAGARAALELGIAPVSWGGLDHRVAVLSSSRNLHLTNRVEAPGGCAPGSPRSGAPSRRPGGRLPTVMPAAVCAVCVPFSASWCHFL